MIFLILFFVSMESSDNFLFISFSVVTMATDFLFLGFLCPKGKTSLWYSSRRWFFSRGGVSRAPRFFRGIFFRNLRTMKSNF